MRPTTCLSLIAGAAFGFGAAGTATANVDVQSGLSNDEVRAIVAEMIADADTRSSLLQSGSAGHDGDFFLASPGGDFRLEIDGQIQFRYIANFGDDDGELGEDFESGFQTRRTKLAFSGQVYERFGFKIQGAFDRDGGDMGLEDAFVTYDMGDGWELLWGQFKAPFLREELVSSKRQLAVDRSLVNETFNQDRSQGVQLGYESDDWTFAIAFTDGFNSDNTDFNNDGGVDYAFTGRGQYKFAGTWRDFRDFTAASGQEFGGLIGVAGHWEGGEDASDEDFDFWAWTADVSLEGDGWNVFGAAVGAYTDADDNDTDDYGFVVQGGILIPETDWELFGRYDVILPDDDRDGDDEFSTITLGANYYIHSHAAKFTVDVVWFLDTPTDNELVGTNTGVGLLNDDDDNQFAIRGQFQLLF
jgi:hypothetical protein